MEEDQGMHGQSEQCFEHQSSGNDSFRYNLSITKVAHTCQVCDSFN